MPPNDGRHRDAHARPPEQRWDASRRGPSIFILVMCCVLAALAVTELVSDDPDLVLVVSQGVLVVTLALGALDQYRTSVTVDGNGVHVDTILRRRAHRWEDISVVRPASASRGTSTIQLVMESGKVISVPSSASRFNVVRRWHDAMRSAGERGPDGGRGL